MGKSWAERHPIIFGAVVGSVVPGIGTLAGAIGGALYDMTQRNEDNPKHKQSTTGDPVLNKTTGEPVE